MPRRKKTGEASVHVKAQDLQAVVTQAPAPQPKTITDWLRRQGEIAVGLIAIWTIFAGLYVFVVTVSGGRLIPWVTEDGARRIAVDVANTVNARMDSQLCGDYNERFIRAQRAVRRNSEDQSALDLFNDVSSSLRGIPNCVPIVLPAGPSGAFSAPTSGSVPVVP